MSKQSGLGAAFWIDGRDLSGDIASLSRMNNARNLLEMTAIDKLAIERTHSHRDGGIEVDSFYNVEAGAAFGAIQDVPATGTRIAMYVHRGSTLGTPAYALVCRQSESTGNRGEDGSFTWTHAMESDGWGVDWTTMLTPGKETDTEAANGTGVDFGAATSFGLQAYLQVFSFTGTDATVTIQESSDNGSGDAWANVTGASFASVTTAPQAQRLQTARNLSVERYLRVVTTTSGGFSNLVFAVGVRKNVVANVI